MYIKEVIIDGFKLYAHRTMVGEFDPLFNAITGLKGNGKSNILDSSASCSASATSPRHVPILPIHTVCFVGRRHPAWLLRGCATAGRQNFP